MTAATNSPTLFAREAELWYAIQIKYRAERRALALLQSKGIETFIPLLEETHRWSDRQKVVAIPLFPGYGFVRLYSCRPTRMNVLRTRGVISFVSFGGETVPVPAKQVDDLRTLLSEKVPCALHAFLTIGQRVRIRGGALNGLEGILEKSGKNNLVISIGSIQRAVAITIEGYELELA